MKFYGQWNPPVDKVLYKNYFTNKRDGFFIECGAYNGVGLSCCKFFEDELGWTGINIEPAKNHYASLIVNRPNCINLNVGLSDTEEVLKFNNVIPSRGAGAGNGSFGHKENHLQELQSYNVKFDEYEIQTITYSKLLSDHNVSQVDLMCLDVEGFEFRVLDGMRDCQVKPEVMCIEYSYLGLKNLVDYMKELGYSFNFISYNNAYFSFSPTDKRWFGSTNKECTIVDGKITWKNVDLKGLR